MIDVDNFTRTFGEIWSDDYDNLDTVNGRAAAQRIFEYVQKGTALELGVGTGRVALRLAELGTVVHGLDQSTEMLSVLKKNDSDHQVKCHVGDMAEIPLHPNQFDLVYIVNNSHTHLLSQDRQQKCFKNACRVLKGAGYFIVEGSVPPSPHDKSSGIEVLSLRENEVHLQISTYDEVSQLRTGQLLKMGSQNLELYPMVLRFTYPSEIDLMALNSGFKLVEEWSDWHSNPRGNGSKRYVKVFQKWGES